MSNEEYCTIIEEITTVAKSIDIEKSDGDGRIDSALKEGPFLKEMTRILLEKHPDWDIIISPPRAPCDIMINSIPINLKLLFNFIKIICIANFNLN